MIGYMQPIKKEFANDEKKLYQSVYCGLCRRLKYEFGMVGILALNYEITNLLLLIEALRTDESKTMKMACSLSPLIWRNMRGANQDVYSKAAELSVIIASFEISDNVQDENRLKDKLMEKIAASKLETVKGNDLLGYLQFEKVYLNYMRTEQDASDEGSGFARVLDSCGTITEQIAIFLAEELDEKLISDVTSIMRLWGEWIYLMDAAEDYENDWKNGMFNPWSLMDAPSNQEEYIELIEEKARRNLMDLPIRRYKGLLEKLFCEQMPYKRKMLFRRIKLSKPLHGEESDEPFI